jgi:arylsulfatase A-like enzyme
MRGPLVLVLVTLGACAAPAPPERPGAVERLRDTKQLRLGTATRSAVPVRPESAFELAVDGPVARVLFSIGMLNGGDLAGRVTFTVRAEGPEGWRPVFSETLGAEAPEWHDRAAEVDAPRTLRFETSVAPAAVADPVACWGSVVLVGPTPASAPNVVVLSLDTLGAAYLSAFGGVPGVSPRIDDFLRHAFAFERAYAQYGSTLVSHSSLFTGLYPIHHGRYAPPVPPLNSLVDVLAAHGWVTVAFTEDAYVGSSLGFASGFDWFDDGNDVSSIAGDAERTFARAAAWLEEFGARTRFFLFVHTYEVHAPYVARDEPARRLADRITPDDRRHFDGEAQLESLLRHNDGRALLDAADIRRYAALYAAEIGYLDRVVGAFLDRLSALGLADDTVVVLTGDHGDQFGEQGKVDHGETLHNRVLHVPLGFRWPGRIAPGRSDSPVQLIDVFPTILEVAGLAVPPALDGRSLAPVLLGREREIPPRAAFAELRADREECGRWRGSGPCRLDRYAVQTERFKYVSSKVPPFERLYDLAADPLETRDVAAEHPDVLAAQRRLLEAYTAAAVPPASAGQAREGTPEGVPDDATRRRLRALGYTD